MVTGPNEDDGDSLPTEEWSKGFGARDCRLASRVGERAGDDNEIERCDAVSFSLSEENDEADGSSSSESGRAVGGGIAKCEFKGVGSGDSVMEPSFKLGRDETLFRVLPGVVMFVAVVAGEGVIGEGEEGERNELEIF